MNNLTNNQLSIPTLTTNPVYRLTYPSILNKNNKPFKIVPKNDRQRLNYTIYTDNAMYGSIRDFAVCFGLNRVQLGYIIRLSFQKSRLDLTADELEIELKCPLIDDSNQIVEGKFVKIRCVISNQDRTSTR